MPKKLKTTQQFIEDAKLVHGDKYDYSLVNYINSQTKIKIICNKDGIVFEQVPNSHLRGCGCPHNSNTKKKRPIESIIKQFKEVHGDTYDYTEVYNTLTDTRSEVKIFCKIHKEYFKQYVYHHIQGSGCPKCGIDRNTARCSFDRDQFIKKFIEVHGTERYNYDLVDTIGGSHKHIKIKCLKCSLVFGMSPSTHSSGSGCPYCRFSKGETKIINTLNKFDIKFYSQHKFEKCRLIKVLPFDFYLYELNICIEFDGRQHFEPVKFSSKVSNEQSIIDFANIQKRDSIKTVFCEENNIDLLRIPYWNFDDIDKILVEKLSRHIN